MPTVPNNKVRQSIVWYVCIYIYIYTIRFMVKMGNLGKAASLIQPLKLK